MDLLKADPVKLSSVWSQWGIGLPTVFTHHQDIPTFIFRWQEDFRHHNQNLALWRWVDVPSAFHICRIVSRVIRRFNIASEFAQFPTTLTVCKKTNKKMLGYQLRKWQSKEIAALPCECNIMCVCVCVMCNIHKNRKSGKQIISDSLYLYKLILILYFQNLHNSYKTKHTFALWYRSGAIKVCRRIPRACNTIVLTEVWLIGAYYTTNAAMDTGVVIMAWRALNWKLNKKIKNQFKYNRKKWISIFLNKKLLSTVNIIQ